MRSRAFALGSILAVACGARTDLDSLADRDPGEEICNGRDDDGDGLVDEGLGEASCGLGACRITVPACVDGVSQTCTARQPTTETCNGEDDDCDGAVDEGLPFGLRSGPHLIDPQLSYLAYGMIVPSSAGFFVAYGTGFDGSAPTPNVHVARLGPSGAPLGSTEVLTERLMPNGLRLTRANDGWLASYCGRFGTEDRAATGLLSDAGAFTEFGLRPPANNHCGAGVPDGAVTPERLLFAFVDNSNSEVWLDVSGQNGQTEDHRLLDERGDYRSMPRFATLGARTLLTYSVFDGERSLLRVHRLRSDGADVGEPLEIAAPGQPAGFRDAALAAGAAGFVLLAHDEAGTALRIRFDADGSVLSGPEPVDALAGLAQLAFAADAAGGFVATGAAADEIAFAARLDEDGEVTALWRSNSAPELAGRYLAFPMVAAGGGSVLYGYTDIALGNEPPLEVIELGCVP